MNKQKELTENEKIEARALKFRGHRNSASASMFNCNQRAPSKLEIHNIPIQPPKHSIEEVEIKKATFLQHSKNTIESVKETAKKIKLALFKNDISKAAEYIEKLNKISHLPPNSMLDEGEKYHIASIKNKERFKKMINALVTKSVNLEHN